MEKLKYIVEWVYIKNKGKLDLTEIKFNIDINPKSIL